MTSPGRTIVVFDDACGFCTTSARLGARATRADRVTFIGASGRDELAARGIGPLPARPSSLVVRTPDGRLLTESRAVAAIAAEIPVVGRVLAAVVRRARPVADRLYRVIARNRHRFPPPR